QVHGEVVVDVHHAVEVGVAVVGVFDEDVGGGDVLAGEGGVEGLAGGGFVDDGAQAGDGGGGGGGDAVAAPELAGRIAGGFEHVDDVGEGGVAVEEKRLEDQVVVGQIQAALPVVGAAVDREHLDA